MIGDDLYWHVPFVEQLQQSRQHFVLGAKPSPHPTLMVAVAAAEGTEQSQTGQWTEGSGARQRTYPYRLVRHVPLALESAVRGTSLEVWEQGAKGELLYHNSWITDLDVEATNVAVVVQIGRTRWKIEKEQFNVHENHGSDLTHTYGHGQQTLARVFSLLNLWAYVTHVVLALGDRLYQRCRAQESRRELWKALRVLVNAVLGERWRHVLQVYLEDADASPSPRLVGRPHSLCSTAHREGNLLARTYPFARIPAAHRPLPRAPWSQALRGRAHGRRCRLLTISRAPDRLFFILYSPDRKLLLFS